MAGIPLDITGERYGRLVAVSVAEPLNGRRRWLCKCDCGKDVVWLQSNLRTGAIKSCGCYRRERGKSLPRTTTHGLSGRNQHPLYGLWSGMLARCSNPANAAYADYGARGISVCERWQGANGLPNFIADMGPRPPGWSIDRSDVNGNYEPPNCRWASAQDQSRNRRNTRVSVEMAHEVLRRLVAGERKSDIAKALSVRFKHVQSVARSAAHALDDGVSAVAMGWGVL